MAKQTVWSREYQQWVEIKVVTKSDKETRIKNLLEQPSIYSWFKKFFKKMKEL